MTGIYFYVCSIFTKLEIYYYYYYYYCHTMRMICGNTIVVMWEFPIHISKQRLSCYSRCKIIVWSPWWRNIWMIPNRPFFSWVSNEHPACGLVVCCHFNDYLTFWWHILVESMISSGYFRKLNDLIRIFTICPVVHLAILIAQIWSGL